MFKAALFRIAKTWKQPSFWSLGEWLNRLWYTHTMEYYSAVKKNKLLTCGNTWMNFTKWKKANPKTLYTV